MSETARYDEAGDRTGTDAPAQAWSRAWGEIVEAWNDDRLEFGSRARIMTGGQGGE